MLDKISEDASVSSVDGGGVEGSASETGGGVDDAEDVEVMVAGDDNGVRLIESLILGEQIGEFTARCDSDAWVQLLNTRDGSIGTLVRC